MGWAHNHDCARPNSAGTREVSNLFDKCGAFGHLDGMEVCRLCDGKLRHAFNRIVLNRHDVSYFECLSCHSLQTERPYWLEEAYAGGNLTLADTGPALRSLNSQAIIFAATRILKFPGNASILDYGGGTGLLCRLLRDIGFDARVFDSYATNDLAKGFEDTGGSPDVLCSFEVAEHFAEPKKDMAAIFDRDARLIIIGTETYRGQGPDWQYISSASGQHIFFYSHKGFEGLAVANNYRYERIGDLHFFLDRHMSKWEGRLLWRAITPLGMKLTRAYLAYNLTSAFAIRDQTLLK